MTFRAGVITFPGSNCDRDIYSILLNFFNAEAEILWHGTSIEKKYDLLVVPGGFSYGDYLRPGAIARFAPAMKSVVEHAKKGGHVIGICNGFQILCEAGLLPGALIQNQSLKYVCRTVELRANPKNRFTAGLEASRIYRIPIGHGDGNYRAGSDLLKELQDNNQIVFTYDDNPNGSIYDIAGITNKEQRVLGMMPHPERATDPLNGGQDGKILLESFLKACRESAYAAS